MTKKIVRNVIIAGVALALFSLGLLLGATLGKARHNSDRQMWQSERKVMAGEINDWREFFLKGEKR
jgi:hypothetical protein